MKQGIIIYSASAGSGKTFSLTANYIVMAVRGDFREIAAITFTNKAAKEMKDRIIEVLQSIASNDSSAQTTAYIDKIKELYKQKYGQMLDDLDLKTKASSLLTQILHNYSFFNVSTIDSFLQKILKSLTKELNLGSFQLILDETKYRDWAIKSLIEQQQAGQDDVIASWLKQMFLKNVDDDKSWNIERTLKDFSKDAFNKDTVINVLNNEEFSKKIDKNNLLQEAEKIKGRIDDFLTKVKRLREEFLSLCARENLTENDFSGASKGSFYVLVNRDLADKKKLTKDLSETLSKKVNAGLMNKGKVCPNGIVSKAEEIAAFFEENITTFLENKLYYDCIFQVGLLKDIADRRDDKKKEDEVFLLQDTNYVLRQLSKEDVPFVFEKTSQRVSDIMIDEFQDTSNIAFEVLNNILEENLSNGNSPYLFGDIKQSIYRWNGGNWQLLNNLSNKPENTIVVLEENFRSNGNIIKFNNDFFSPLYNNIGIKYENQKLPSNKEDKANEGLVRIRFIGKQGDNLNSLMEEIDFYHDTLGYEYGDIGVLFRDNKKLVEAANYIKDNRPEYNPVSDISFTFKNSPAVGFIISALRYLSDREDTVSKEIISQTDGAIPQIDKLRYNYNKTFSLLELVMQLAVILKIDDDMAFVPAFYDIVKEYSSSNRADIEDFLDYWDEQLSDKSVDLTGTESGLNMITIHKSKGLAYRVVIVPYLWDCYKNKAAGWFETNSPDGLPIFHAMYSSLKGTDYQPLYDQERKNQYVDNLNLLYVAFTRAKDHLSIINNYTPPKSQSTTESTGKMLYDYIHNNNSSVAFYEQSEGLFTNQEATITPQTNKQETNNNQTIVIDKISFNQKRVNFSLQDKDDLLSFFDSSFEGQTQRAKGSTYHYYISKMQTKEDIDNIVALANLAAEDSQKIQQIAYQMIQDSEPFHWFDNTYKVLNERSILDYDTEGGLQVKRPDRIMVSDTEVIVVDYKFGNKNPKYHKQVAQYMILLESLFPNKTIKGYLWYINVDEQVNTNIEQVK